MIYIVLRFRRGASDNRITSETRSQNDISKIIRASTINFDIKDILDRNSQQFWNDVKAKFMDKEKQDTIKMLEEIYSKFRHEQVSKSFQFHSCYLSIYAMSS